jgi:hypothetical protein
MPELGTYGSVRGAVGNNRPYREHRRGRGRSIGERECIGKRAVRDEGRPGDQKPMRQSYAGGLPWRRLTADAVGRIWYGAELRCAGGQPTRRHVRSFRRVTM